MQKENIFSRLLPQFSTQANKLSIGHAAPLFQLTAHDGSEFNLAARQGVGWTVLYFYPKAATPGCTKQACVFRDSVQAIYQHHAEVYGISTDNVASLLRFHNKHNLSFALLADPDAKVTNAYGAKMPLLNMAKRWTFIIDPQLVIRHIDANVDPVKDAQRVLENLITLQQAG
jgi:peroxiredoxin Q/BCP